MRYRLAIFDFDGTLADSLDWIVRTLNELAPRHGFRQVGEHEIAALRGRPNREIMQQLRVPAWRLPRIAADLRARMAAEAEAIRLFDGIEVQLGTLQRGGLRIAVVSSNAEANVRRILGPTAVATIAAFDCGATLFGKAQRFRRVMRRTGCTPAETICIGDESRDLEAAHAAGAGAGAVLWGCATAELLARYRPALTFRAVGELAEQLLARPAG